MSANASDHPANKMVVKVIVDKGLGKNMVSTLYIYIFMVASDVASSFVHSVPQTLELVE